VTLALYVPRSTVVHRAPAGLKLLVLSLGGVLVFAVPTLPVAAGALVAVLAVGLFAAELPLELFGRQARTLGWWLVALMALHLLTTDLETGAVAVLRLLALVLAAAVVTATTRVTEMVAVVERLCAPLRLVGVRPARVGLVIAMALRFVPVLAERADAIREAQAARGGRVRGLRATATMVVPLLVSVLRMADTVGEALDARGADDVPARFSWRRRAEGRPS
jgi:biotin transport system permease protein